MNCDKSCTKCQRRHHVLLYDESRERQRQTQVEASGDKPKEVKDVVTTMTVKSKSQASLGVLPVRIQVNGQELRTHALIDSGSNTTLVKRELVNKLGIKGCHSPFSVNTLNGTQTHQQELMCKFQVSSDDRQECITVEALTVPDIPIQASSKSSFKKDWPHLRDVHIPSVANEPIEIVIGTDCPEMFWSLEERRAGRKEPIA